MSDILLRASKYPWEALSAAETLQQGALAKNAGNLLFGQSVYRTLSVPGATITPDKYESHRSGNDVAYAAWVNNSFDHFVIPLANAFRPAFREPLRRLTELIRRLEIPVTVIGVGSQHKLAGESVDDDLNRDVRSFMSAVLERSASVGVRGEYTAGYLRDVGFGDEHVDIIGCPSVFMNGMPAPVETGNALISTDSRIAMTVSPYVRKLNAIVASHVKRYPNLVYIPQNHSDLNMMVWGESRSKPKNKWNPTHTEHPLYLEDRMRFPLDPRTWIEYLADFDFLFGSRIHGTIAGILAGIPSMLLVHDTRTLELAEYHSIPHVRLADISKSTDARDLFERADYRAYNERQPEVLSRFITFLEKNDLEHVFAEGNEPAEFDAKLSNASLPPMVATLFAKGDDGRMTFFSRINDLHKNLDSVNQRLELLERQELVRDSGNPMRHLVPRRVRAAGKRILRPRR